MMILKASNPLTASIIILTFSPSSLADPRTSPSSLSSVALDTSLLDTLSQQTVLSSMRISKLLRQLLVHHTR